MTTVALWLCLVSFGNGFDTGAHVNICVLVQLEKYALLLKSFVIHPLQSNLLFLFLKKLPFSSAKPPFKLS